MRDGITSRVSVARIPVEDELLEHRMLNRKSRLVVDVLSEDTLWDRSLATLVYGQCKSSLG